MKLSSVAFQHQKSIPSKYTCDDSDVSPPLQISGVPPNAKSLALVMDDPDAPMGTWDHLVMWNLSPDTEIKEGTLPKGTVGKNSWGKTNYGGPCPPSGTHRYFFKLYALDTVLNLPAGSTKKQLKAAMKGHILAEAVLMGTYQRTKR